MLLMCNRSDFRKILIICGKASRHFAFALFTRFCTVADQMYTSLYTGADQLHVVQREVGHLVRRVPALRALCTPTPVHRSQSAGTRESHFLRPIPAHPSSLFRRLEQRRVFSTQHRRKYVHKCEILCTNMAMVPLRFILWACSTSAGYSVVYAYGMYCDMPIPLQYIG